MAEERLSFWERFFRQPLSFHSEERERKVIEYIIHRIGEGAHLRDVLGEEYVRRNASRAEIDDILQNPRLIESAHEQMRDDFTSGRLAPNPHQSGTR
jgi:hypothetical protein